MRIDSEAVHGAKGGDETTGAVSFPIYQSATFRHPGLNRSTGYDYSRLQNPTREEAERAVARLERGRHGFAFSSGMAAVTTVLKLFGPGDHIVVSDDLYGGTYRIFEEVYKGYGLEYEFVDTTSLEEVRRCTKKNTKCFFIETPSNPMMKVSDISAISAFAHERGAIAVIDNTFLTPYFQRPLGLGADAAVHSGTKYLGGHNDTLAGFIVINDDKLAERLLMIQKTEGAVLAPFDSWLILRGMKTLAVRMEKQQSNAGRVAEWLRGHPHVEKVYYTGLPDHPEYELSRRQASGFGAMLSFSVDRFDLVERTLAGVKMIQFAESLGGVESLITYPIAQTHNYIPKDILYRLGVTDRLLRLSVGIENADDIIEDLEQAMR
jgi:cystathionine gamma-synthase